MEKIEIKLELPTKFKQELIAEATARQIASLQGFSNEEIEELETALGEACINVIEHSKVKDKRIKITFTISEDYLTVVVEDAGIGFDPEEIEKPDIKEKIGSVYKRGWGLMLIENLMDEIEFKQKEPHGTILTMKKYKSKKKLMIGNKNDFL